MNGRLRKKPIGVDPFRHISATFCCALEEVLSVLLLLSLALLPLESQAVPKIDELMDYLSMSTAERKQVFNGDMVSRVLEETSDSELSAEITFVLPKSPKSLGQIFIDGSKMGLTPKIVAHGILTPETTASDLSGVSFRHDESEEINQYLNIGSGDRLNLSSNEITAFKRLTRKDPTDTTVKVKVEMQLRALLLDRYQAYRAGGLAAINPYARDDNERYLLSNDLGKSLKTFGFIKFFFPEIYKDLIGFPKTTGSTPKENYFWVKLIFDGRPNFVLSHRMVFSDGNAQILFSRHFYVSNSYNGQQEAAILIPFNQGSLVYYNNRTYSDKVGGFGSDVKQAFGRKILSSSLIGLFTKVKTLQ